MNNEEKLTFKLNMIYDEMLDLRYKLDKIENKKRKEELEKTMKRNQDELEEINRREDYYWEYREKKLKEFNCNYGEVEEVNR